MKVRNIFGSRFSGAIGKDVIASSWKGIEYLRAYRKPKDPKSKRQLERRGEFAEAIRAWQSLSESERDVYRKMDPKGMSAYNLFVRLYLEAAREGRKL